MDKPHDRRVPAKRPVRRARPAQDASRTKFDKWLERVREDGTKVTLEFAVPPRSDWNGNRQRADFYILDVDRYMLQVQFRYDSEVWWVSKSIICGASVAKEQD